MINGFIHVAWLAAFWRKLGKDLMHVQWNPVLLLDSSHRVWKLQLVWGYGKLVVVKLQGAPLTDHASHITPIKSSPNVGEFASGSLDGIVRFWDTRAPIDLCSYICQHGKQSKLLWTQRRISHSLEFVYGWEWWSGPWSKKVFLWVPVLCHHDVNGGTILTTGA